VEFPIKPRTGRELRKVYMSLIPFKQSIYDSFIPFKSTKQPNSIELLPEEERMTLLASNSNYPNELQTNAFVQASAVGEGSPQIIQYSYNSLSMEGGDPNKMKLPIRRFTELRPTAIGAMQAKYLLSKYASLYGADMLFMALDHFTSPSLEEVEKQNFRTYTKGLEFEIARTKIISAAKTLKEILGETDDKIIDKFAEYMVSGSYQSFRKDFLAAIRFGEPAWAMIDTGGLPTILNFATTRDITDAVRTELNNYDVMLEAELSATGQSGQKSHYKYWKDMSEEEKVKEKALAVLFVRYGKPDAIAYEIGMEHAARAGEKHEPDEEKLKEIQSELWIETRKYIPFAQHGGTGSSKIIKGLVGKYNVNTQYLQAGALAELKRSEEMKEGIINRDKKAIGTDRFLDEIKKVREKAIEYLNQTGTFGLSPTLREVLKVKEPSLPEYSASNLNSIE